MSAPAPPAPRILRYTVERDVDHGEHAPDSGVSVVKVARELVANAPRNGAEITNIPLPASVLDPVSALEKPMKAMKRGELLPALFPGRPGAAPVPRPWEAAVPAPRDAALVRLLRVVEFVLSGYPVEKFGKKPYNPVLGEVFRGAFRHADAEAHGVTFLFAEQVSHHPPVSAIHWHNDTLGFEMTSVAQPATRFWGNTVEIRIGGTARLVLRGVGDAGEDEEYHITRPTVFQSGILGVGKQRVEFVGEVTVTCPATDLELVLEFKANKMLGMRGDMNAVVGKVRRRSSTNGEAGPPLPPLARRVSRSGPLGALSLGSGPLPPSSPPPVAELSGRWDGEVTVTFPDEAGRPGSSAVLFDFEEARERYSMRVWLPPDEEVEENNSMKAWAGCSDAIWRKDTRAANEEKKKVEEAQRALRRKREESGEVFTPKYFEPAPSGDGYVFKREAIARCKFEVGPQ